jgi:hypothetical protein
MLILVLKEIFVIAIQTKYGKIIKSIMENLVLFVLLIVIITPRVYFKKTLI